MAIVTAMENAYIEYSNRLGAEQNVFADGECDPFCYGEGDVDSTDCACDCDSASLCCGIISDSSTVSSDSKPSWTLAVALVLFFVFVVGICRIDKICSLREIHLPH